MAPISLRALKVQREQRRTTARVIGIWNRHKAWMISNFSLPARIVIVVGEITIAYTMSVFGFAVAYFIVSS
jgi:hypothetical protein